jgi:hypothetical protein
VAGEAAASWGGCGGRGEGGRDEEGSGSHWRHRVFEGRSGDGTNRREWFEIACLSTLGVTVSLFLIADERRETEQI